MQPWKKERDEIVGHIDHALLKSMAGTAARIVTLLRDSCLNEGTFVPSWHGKYVSEKYSLSSRVKFIVECHFQVSAPTGDMGGNVDAPGTAEIKITANDFTNLFCDTLYVNGKIFRTLKGAPAVKNGFPYFECTGTGNDESGEQNAANMLPLRTKMCLVTAPDKVPYTPLTRRQYLEEARQEVQLEKEKLIAAIKEKTPIRSTEVQKAEKEKEMDGIRQTYSGAEREMRLRRLLESYQTDEDYQKEGIERGTVDIDKTLHLMDSLLMHLSAKDLKEPARVSVPAIKFVAFEDSLPGSRMLVQVNQAYFDAALPVDKAQCFLVCWNYNPSEAMAADIDGQLHEKLNFKILQDLLGK
jgi:hypothetical protein